jgi:hypothetical protein
MTRVVGPVQGACASCGRPLAGPYCAQCGERVLDPEARTVRHFLTRTVPEEVFDVDGKLWRTLRYLLARPGFLSQEYSAGRRTPYLPPLRLLLLSIVVYALATQGGFLITMMLWRVTLSIAPTAVPTSVSVPDTVERIDRFEILSRMLEAKRQSIDVTSDAARVRFHETLNRFAQPVSFANVVLLAVVLHLAFRRIRPLFVENAVFSMHAVSFVLVSSLTLVPVTRIMTVNRPAGLIWILTIFTLQFLYLAAAVRRYYFTGASAPFRPRLYAAIASLLIYVVNSAFVTVVQMVGGAIALRSL